MLSPFANDTFDEANSPYLRISEDPMTESQFGDDFDLNAEHDPVFSFDEDGDVSNVINTTKQGETVNVIDSLHIPFQDMHNFAPSLLVGGDPTSSFQLEGSFDTSAEHDPVFSFEGEESTAMSKNLEDGGGGSSPSNNFVDDRRFSSNVASFGGEITNSRAVMTANIYDLAVGSVQIQGEVLPDPVFSIDFSDEE